MHQIYLISFILFYLTFIYCGYEFKEKTYNGVVCCGFALKKQLEETKNKKKREEKNATQKLKSAIIVSAVVAAVAGAVFALTKKLRENK